MKKTKKKRKLKLKLDSNPEALMFMLYMCLDAADIISHYFFSFRFVQKNETMTKKMDL